MSPVLLFAILVLCESCLSVVAIRSRRDLRRHGARPAAYALLVTATLLSVLSPPIAAWGFGWLPVALLVPAVAIYLVPSFAVKLTGGPLPRWGLALAAKEIGERWDEISASGGGTEADADWLISQSRLLDRWRSPDTDELIDLYQEKISDLLHHEDRLEFRKRVAARNARIDELVDSYWHSGGE